jgi:palmitoyltransferase
MPRRTRHFDPNNAFLLDSERGHLTEIEAFRLRQIEDLKRFQENNGTVRRRQRFHTRFESTSSRDDAERLPESGLADLAPEEEGEEAWRNAEGDRLADFGIDEEAEFYDEEDIPLAELIRRRKNSRSKKADT